MATDPRLPNGWTLCAGCPVRQQPSEEAQKKLAEIREDYMSEHHFWDGDNTHPAMISRVERDADCHMELVAEYAALLRGRPDTLEGERERELRARVFQASYQESEGKLYGKMGAAQALIRLLDERAALRVGGAQNQEDSGER